MESLYIQLNDLHTGAVCKCCNWGPSLGPCSFHTLLWIYISRISYCLLLCHVKLYCLGTQAEVKLQMQQRHVIFIMNLPQCLLRKWLYLYAFIHPFIQLMRIGSPLCARIHSTFMLRMWIVQFSTLKCLTFEWGETEKQDKYHRWQIW